MTTTKTTRVMNGKLLATEEAAIGAGQILYWTCPATTVDAHRAACQANGLVGLDAVTSERALSRVAKGLERGRVHAWQTTEGWAIVEEVDGQEVAGRTVAVLSLTSRDGVTTVNVREVERVAYIAPQSIVATWQEMMTVLSGAQIGAWAVEQIARAGGIALRPTGGFYYLEARAAELAERMATVISACGGKLYSIPAVRSTGLLDAVLDAARAEADAALESLLAELVKPLGKRAMETREERLSEIAEKLTRYERNWSARAQRPVQAKIIAIRARLAGAPAVLPTCDHDDCWEEASGGMGATCRARHAA